MAQTLKIRKGDTVQVMKGKDRGKQGRVLEASPKDGRILVENVNMIVRHQRPRPISQASRMEAGPAAIAQSSDDDDHDAKVLQLHRKER